MGDKRENAYFTVEASLIYPITLFITVMMIFLAFYTYDRCVLDHSAYQSALMASSNHIKSNSKNRSLASIASEALTHERVFAYKEFSSETSAKNGKVTVSYHMVVNMPFKSILNGLCGGISDETMTLDISKSAPKLRPTRLIRTSRGLRGLADKLIDSGENEAGAESEKKEEGANDE